MSEEKIIRTLVIKTFHIEKVQFSNRTYIENRTLYLRKSLSQEVKAYEERFINNLEVEFIYPDNHQVFINSVMDFSPIAAKVLGRLGEGITHAITGTTVMLTGVDKNGVQVSEFGSSEGVLSESVVFNRAGTPSSEDIIIHVDIELKEGMGTVREAISAAHRACDRIVQEIRAYLKKMNGRFCDEKFEYCDTVKPGKKKVVIVKQVAGQGAMYDTLLFAKEPGGFEGGRSIIDIGNAPVILSPNEYRDGALRAMH